MRLAMLPVSVLLCGLPQIGLAGSCDTAHPVTLEFDTITEDYSPNVGCTTADPSESGGFSFSYDLHIGGTDLAAARAAVLNSCSVSIRYWIEPELVTAGNSSTATAEADVHVTAHHWNGSSWQVVGGVNNRFEYVASTALGGDISGWIQEVVPVPLATLWAMSTPNDGFTIQSDNELVTCSANPPSGNSQSQVRMGPGGVGYVATLVYVPWIP